MSSGFCARPGCGQLAEAWLSYDYGAQTVWLDDSPQDNGDAWGMCAAHAARLRVPQGWSTQDRRKGWSPRARLAG